MIKYIGVFLGIVLGLSAYAWNEVGHKVIANIAYQHLEPDVRKKVDQMVCDLATEYPYIKQFIQIAPWADTLRSQKIDIYTHWHYINTPFSDDGTPLKDLNDTDNLIWAIQRIEPVMKYTNANTYEHARFLAFLVHIVGDSHQPLHTVSRISAAHPDGDEGGNFFYIKGWSHRYRHQISNLHQLWDGGVGLFDVDATPENINALTTRITTDYPESAFGDKVNDLDPKDWIQEGLKLSESQVYRTSENQPITPMYREVGQRTVEERTALAGYRLANLLNTLLIH